MSCRQQQLGVCVLLFIFSGALLSAPHRLPSDPQSIPVTMFDDAVMSVLASSRADQSRFAELAIEIMVDAYRAELNLTKVTAARPRSNVATWDIGTRRFIAQLETIAASLSNGARVSIIKESHGATRIVVGNDQVMLSAPRLNEQAAFEQAIAESVCTYVMCGHITNSLNERVSSRTQRLQSTWEFSPRKPPRYSSSDGLNCVFDDTRHLKLKKDACVALLHEVRLLAESFSALKSHGKTINWSQLQIKHVGAGAPQKITYNATNGFFNMRLPGLVRAQTVMREAIPWIRANIQGRVYHHVIKLPNQLVYLTPTSES